jgi:hypothetical protein
MTAEYQLIAIPSLIAEGQFEGELKGITFLAVSPTDRIQWFAINCGQFERAFCKLIPTKLTEMIFAALLCGDEVEFPGRYRKDQFDGGFHYVWSPCRIGLSSLTHRKMRYEGLDSSRDGQASAKQTEEQLRSTEDALTNCRRRTV